MTVTDPGKCDQATIDHYEKLIGSPTGPRYYGVNTTVLNVAIDPATKQEMVTLEVFGTDGKPRQFELGWCDESQMWAPCPSTLPSQAQHGNPGPPPAVGAVGVLYLHRDETNNRQLQTTTSKWPLKY